jgi:hypothetical protein
MPQARLDPQELQDNQVYRYYRNEWMAAGVDNFTLPPAQNADMFEVLTNVLPPATNVFGRRFAYKLFTPKLDLGSGDGS